MGDNANMSMLDYLMIKAREAYRVGHEQTAKTRYTKYQLKKILYYNERNYYFTFVWEAYKAGLFTRKIY